MRILVTGGSGSLAREIYQQAMEQELEIYSYARTELDITDPQQLQAVFAEIKPEAVINCAAYTNVDKAEADPEACRAVNTRGALNAAELCARYRAFLVQVSTDYVFGDTPGPHGTAEDPAPVNVYGRSKLLAEEGCRRLCRRLLIVRTGTLFGRSGRNIVRTVADLCRPYSRFYISKQEARTAVPPTLRFISDNLIQPTPAAALAQALLTMLTRILEVEAQDPHAALALMGSYHYTGTPAVSSADFARAIIDAAFAAGRLTLRPPVLNILNADYAAAACRPRDLRLDNSKTARDFNLQPPDWRPVLQQMFKRGQGGV